MNFADTHQRENDYLAKAELPLIPGGEISRPNADGRRVAAMLANGGYAEKVVALEAALVPDPRRGQRRSGRRGAPPGPDRVDAAEDQRSRSSAVRASSYRPPAAGPGPSPSSSPSATGPAG